MTFHNFSSLDLTCLQEIVDLNWQDILWGYENKLLSNGDVVDYACSKLIPVEKSGESKIGKLLKRRKVYHDKNKAETLPSRIQRRSLETCVGCPLGMIMIGLGADNIRAAAEKSGLNCLEVVDTVRQRTLVWTRGKSEFEVISDWAQTPIPNR